jgi:hypothetical protein
MLLFIIFCFSLLICTITVTIMNIDPAMKKAAAATTTEDSSHNFVYNTTMKTRDTDLSYQYTGQLIHGKPHGRGIAKFLSTNESYEGLFKDGFRHGFGVFTYNCSDVYAGQWFRGNRHGHGLHRWEDGAVYDGEWFEGLTQGFGTMKWSTGSYSGQWHHARQNGFGRMRGLDYIYEGYFVDDLFHGHGTIRWDNGDIYTGGWQENIRFGHGTLTRVNRHRIEGTWLDAHVTCVCSYDQNLVCVGHFPSFPLVTFDESNYNSGTYLEVVTELFIFGFEVVVSYVKWAFYVVMKILSPCSL